MTRANAGPEAPPAAYGAWLLVAAAAAGTALSVYDWFAAPGINHTIGVLVVIISSALVTAAALIVALARALPRWLRIVLRAAILLGLLGTALAAWFLEAPLLLAFMAVGLIGWLLGLFSSPGPAGRTLAPGAAS